MDAKPVPPDLSPREKEILALLLDGKAPKAIGFELNIGFPTVKFHQKNIYKSWESRAYRSFSLYINPTIHRRQSVRCPKN
jgi:DNA-binding NarL/FixJ family response regulator